MPLPSSFSRALIVDQDVTFPVAQHAAAFNALKSLWDEEMLSRPDSDDPFVIARALKHLLETHGWSTNLSLVGNLVGLSPDLDGFWKNRPACSAEDASALFSTLAPFVEEGCYISFAEPAKRHEGWSVVFSDQEFLVEKDQAIAPSQASAA